MASGYLRFKVAEWLEEYSTNLHAASQVGGFSYPTVHRYMYHPDEVMSVYTRAVVGLLHDALGLSVEEIEELKFGDVFEVVLDGGEGQRPATVSGPRDEERGPAG